MPYNSIKVKSCPAYSHFVPFSESLWCEPVPFINFLKKSKGNAFYLECPSLNLNYKNCFLITSPIDININVSESGQVSTDLQPDIEKLLIQPRPLDEGSNTLISFRVFYYFVSEKSLPIQQFQPSILSSQYPHLSSISMIDGEFDIGKWVRPLDFAFEINTQPCTISIKRGDPLYSVRFKTDKFVDLDFDNYENELISKTHHNQSSIKSVCPINNLNKNYKLASSQMKSLSKKLFTKKFLFSIFK